MIIGICGLIGSGKGTVADYLIGQHNFQKISFADKLKDAVAEMFEWPRPMLEGVTPQSRGWRERPDVFWSNELGREITPRYVLQIFGTECMRQGFYDGIWVSLVKKKIQDRLAMLSGKVGMVKVGAASKVELKEKKDRVEDAIYATKAALKEGIVPGGGIALLNAAQDIVADNDAEKILLSAIKAPYNTILDNAGIIKAVEPVKGQGVDVNDGTESDMIQAGIIDPVLVTKSALKNAVSVVTTIISADCIISNMRGDASSK